MQWLLVLKSAYFQFDNIALVKHNTHNNTNTGNYHRKYYIHQQPSGFSTCLTLQSAAATVAPLTQFHGRRRQYLTKCRHIFETSRFDQIEVCWLTFDLGL